MTQTQSNTNAPPAPDWFGAVIRDGLKELVVLGLPGQPGDDVIAYTRRLWCDVLWRQHVDWREDLDAQRLRAAFRQLAASARRWPAPALLMEQLPPREQPRSLPRPKLTPEQRARARARIRELAQEVTDGNQ